ncbi:MAG: urea ABC transporter permease subunit UrtB, partial [Methylobacterium sp.]
MIRLLTLLFLLLAGPALAQAPDPYAQLAGESYAEIEAGVAGLAASGDPRAGAVLSALSEGRLLARPSDKALFIRQGSALTDAKTGAAAPDDPALKAVRANNRVRRGIEAAQGQLNLVSPDPAKRREAADAVFKARDAAALPALDTALAREKDAGVKQV